MDRAAFGVTPPRIDSFQCRGQPGARYVLARAAFRALATALLPDGLVAFAALRGANMFVMARFVAPEPFRVAVKPATVAHVLVAHDAAS